MNKEEQFSEFCQLSGRVLNGEASEAEKSMHRQMISQSSEFRDIYYFLKPHWNNLHRIDWVNTRDDWQKFRSEVISTTKPAVSSPELSSSATFRKLIPYAAAVAILVSVSWWLLISWGVLFPHELVSTRIEAPAGSRTRVALPDGSWVWLNAGSTLEYSNDFNIRSRRLKLSGEAFFEVTKSKKPFIVHTSLIRIQVLGTSFNVKAYPDDAYTEATLVSGSIQIKKEGKEGPVFKDITLQPNQKAVFSHSDGGLQLSQLDAQMDSGEEHVETKPVISNVTVRRRNDLTPEIGWKDGILVLEREPFTSLMRRLERLYNVEFVFDDQNLKNYHYSGKLVELTLEQMMLAIKETSPINYRIEDKVVYISTNPEYLHKYQILTTPKHSNN